SGVVGPFDFRPSTVGQTIIAFAHRRLLAYVPGTAEFVSVRDVVAGHLLAMERGLPGERYILSGESLSLDHLFDLLSTLCQAPRPWVRLPASVMLPFSHVANAVTQRLL